MGSSITTSTITNSTINASTITSRQVNVNGDITATQVNINTISSIAGNNLNIYSALGTTSFFQNGVNKMEIATGGLSMFATLNMYLGNVIYLYNTANSNTWTQIAGGTNGNSWSIQQSGGYNYEIRYLNSTGSFTVTSDRNSKKNIEFIPDGILDKYIKLKPCYFHYNLETDETADKNIGFIAQDVQEFFMNTHIVSKNNDGILSVNYGNFITLSIKAIQEQNVIVQSLQSTVQQQATEITALQLTVASQSTQVLQAQLTAQQIQIVQLMQRLSAAGIA